MGKASLIGCWLTLMGCGARTPLDAPPISVDSNDESCDGAPSLVTLASSLDAPSAMAMNGNGVLWLTGNPTSHEGTLQRCGRCGCRNTPTTLATGLDWNDTPNAYPLPALVTDGTNAYFNGGDHVYACALTGCNGSPTLVASKQSPGGISVAGGSVYWTNFNVLPSTVMMEPANGSKAPMTLVSLDGDWELISILVRSETIYFVSFDAIMTCSISGCASATTFAKATPPTGGLAADDVSLYWANRYASSKEGATLEACPLSGCQGAPRVIATGLADNHFRAVATDGVNVYWADFSDGTISKCPVTGCAGAPIVMASGQASPVAIAVDDTSVYWANTGTPNFDKRDGSVMKLTPK